MEALFGDAVWIGGNHPFDLHEVYLNFSSPPILGKSGESAELLISADSRYRLWLNGALMGRGPSRSYPHAQSVDRINLSKNWKSGTNQIAVQVYQPGYSHFSYVHRAAAGLLAALRVNGQIKLISDTTWRVQRDASFSAEVPRISIYGSGIEVQDLSRQSNWRSMPQDDTWENARPVSGIDGPIWTGLRKRDTPKLIEQERPFPLVEQRLSDLTLNTNLHPNQIHAWMGSAWRNGRTVAGTTSHSDQPIHLTPSAGSGSAMWLYDLGRAHTCQGGLEITGAAGGETVLISYADKLNDGEVVFSDPDTYCRVRPTDQFKLRPGEQMVESFSMRGGRYVIFLISGFSSDTFVFTPHIRTAEYPLQITNPLTTGDLRLNKIIDLCENTFKACLQDSFVDCVWRESSQWLGDGFIQSKLLASMSDDLSLIRKLLHDTAAGQDKQGLFPSIAPGEVHAYNIPRYGCMWVECLAFYLRESDDQRFLIGMIWDALLRWVDGYLMTAPKDDKGLYLNPAGRRHYIDWSATSQNDPHCVINLHIVLALQEAAWLAEQIDPSKSKLCLERADRLKQTCRGAFYHDGIWYDDLEKTTHSQLAAALALRVGCVNQTEQPGLLASIIGRSLDLNDDHVPGQMVIASPFMHHYIFETLYQYNQEQAIIDIILARWGRWADDDCPTTWENWNIDFPDGSACHAFSAHPRYHLAKVLPKHPRRPLPVVNDSTVPDGSRNTP